MKTKYLLFFALILAFSACTSGKSALERGDYEAAVLKAVNRLRANTDNKKAIYALKEAYPLALNWNLNLIERHKISSDKFKWEKVLTLYRQLNFLHDEINRCHACLAVVPNVKLFSSEANEARELAAAARYEAGDKLMTDPNRTRFMAKEAFFNFNEAANLIQDYKDTRSRMDEARYYATFKVIVEQIPINSRLFAFSDEFFRNNIYSYISQNPRMNDFVRFYTPNEAQAENLKNPDHVVRLQFDDFVVGQTFVNTNTETLTSKDSVKVGEVKVDGKTIPVLNRVTAKFTVHKKTIVSKGLLDLQIIDAYSGKVIHQDKMVGEFTWFSEWGNFNGDERALTKKEKDICNQREFAPPPPQDLFIEFCKPLHDQATQKIRYFYRNY